MAAPFEKRPQLREYLEWARTEGFTETTGHNGNTGFVILICPDGHQVPIVDFPMSEALSPGMVSWLNRRTGVVCPFSGAPEPYC